MTIIRPTILPSLPHFQPRNPLLASRRLVLLARLPLRPPPPRGAGRYHGCRLILSYMFCVASVSAQVDSVCLGTHSPPIQINPSTSPGIQHKFRNQKLMMSAKLRFACTANRPTSCPPHHDPFLHASPFQSKRR
jgi:hypothetical protein